MTTSGHPHPHQITADALRARIAGKVFVDRPIARYTSFRLGGPAAVLVEPDGPRDLLAVAEVLKMFDSEALVLGRGTNLLVSDSGFPGVVIHLTKSFDWIRAEVPRIEAGGSTQLPRVANKASRLGLTGLEFAIAIPATVGGAVRMNAGAHGSWVSSILESAAVIRLDEAVMEEVDAQELDMRYRETAVRAGDVVCSAIFRLEPGNPREISSRINDYRRHRIETQPVDAPNAGSMFRNPPGNAAGYLIEMADLKGARVGGAEVSKKHANFFLAHDGARSQDVYDLMARVQRKVAEQSGIVLVPEVRMVGAFDRSAGLVEAT